MERNILFGVIFFTVLDEVSNKDEQNTGEPTLKTRSLPAWVRSKPRPLSTEDDINDLYAKVSYQYIYISRIINLNQSP